jgi:DNA-binding CsgD family transcriptional regulator
MPGSAVPGCTPLVGRRREMARLAEALDDVLRAGRPHVVLLTGAGGVGKSRLVQEALDLTRDRGLLPLQGTAGPLQRDLSLAPVVEALRPLVHGTGPTGRARIAALVEGLSDLTRLFDGLPLVPPLPLSDLGLERTRLFEAVTRLLDRAAAERPVALVLDDLHWADPASLALLHYAVRGLADRPVLFLLAFRDAEVEPGLRELTTALRCGAVVTELPLAALDPGSVEELARALLGGAVPSGLVTVLTQRAAGIPLFVAAVVSGLVEQGALFRSGGRWVLGTTTTEAVPPAVQSLLQGQVERLPARLRGVLEALAVCGGRVPEEVLAATVGDEADLPAAVAALCDLGLVDQDLRDGRVGYQVTHPLLAEVTLALMSASARRDRHAAAAGAWQRLAPEAVGTIAVHVIGAGSAVEPEYALDVLLRASAEALSRRAGEQAAAAVRAALPVAEGLQRDDLRGPLLTRLAEAEELAGRLEPARTAWRTAAEPALAGAAASETEVTERARRLHRAALAGWDLGRFDEAARDLDEAEAALAGLPPGPVHVAVIETRARIALRRGDAAAEREYAARLADVVAVTGSARARVVAGLIDLQLAAVERRFRDAVDRTPEALTLAEQLGDPLLISATQRLATHGAVIWGDVPAARQHAEDGLRRATATGVPTLQVMHLVDRGYVDILAGRWDEALQGLAAAFEIAERTGLARGTAIALTNEARVLAHRGRLDDAARLTGEVSGRVGPGATPDVHVVVLLELAKAQIALARRQYARAAEHARRCTQQAQTLAPGLFALAVASQATGDRETAAGAAHELAALGPGAPYPCALAEWVRGRLDRDPDLLASAAAALAALGIPYEAALARVDLAEALAATGAGADASEHAGAALDVFDRLSAKPQADRASALLRALGRPPVPTGARAAAGRGLSRREEEVARLVAAGLSNAEIADRLFISQRTVTTHLQHVYARLGLRSRTALTRYVVEQLAVTADT